MESPIGIMSILFIFSFLQFLVAWSSTVPVESSLEIQRLTTVVFSENITAISSSHLQSSSDALVATTVNSASLSSLRQPTSPIGIPSSVTIASPSSISASFKTTNVTHFSRETSVKLALSSTQQPQLSSVIGHSAQTASTQLSQSRVLTAKMSSVNLSATSSSQTLPLSGVPVFTSSIMALPSSPLPSASELAITSSVIIIPPGFFVRFGISVPLNKSVSDARFKQELEKRILVAYENGSVGGMPGNVSVNVS